MFLTRARLRRDRGLEPLAAVLLPQGGDARVDIGHRLVWTLFGDTADRRRDFLWREQEPGVFLLLSARAPEDRAGLFALDPPKPFAPLLATGDRLTFLLRANAVVARSSGPDIRGKRQDVVADALARLPVAERAERRREVLGEAANGWLARQGAAGGFRPVGEVAVEGDEWRRIRREGNKPITFNVLDFAGQLEVTEPDQFLPALARGFGRAKAFGCGLMLIRRT